MASLCRTIRRNGYFITPRKVERKPTKGKTFMTYVKVAVKRLVSFLKGGL